MIKVKVRIRISVSVRVMDQGFHSTDRKSVV